MGKLEDAAGKGVSRDTVPPESANSSLPPEKLKAALELWSQAGGAHYIPLRGTSMLPLLHDGDQVLVSHNRTGIHSGDIVVFQRINGLLAHRVLWVDIRGEGRTLRTKGDNALRLDSIMTKDELVGRVLVVRRGNRKMNLDTPAFRASGKVIAAVMLAQSWLYQKAGGADVGETAREIRRSSTILGLGILRFGAILIKVSQGLFSRWELDDDPTT